MILGKFLPPTRGHQYLADFAQNCVDHLTVIVGTLAAEPIPGEVRYAWMKEMFPRAEVLHLTDENPQYPHEHPDFWRIWRDSIRRLLPSGPDYLFASEDYGFKLAEILGAEYVPVDHARELVPVSGTAVRENPMMYWEYIPEPVRPWFVRRVCIVGPESTGKTVLARRLARYFNTVWVSEYARGLIALQNNEVTPETFPKIVRGQIASEEALACQANRVLVCDTDSIVTSIWAEHFCGVCPAWVLEEADRRQYDLYLLMEPDAPWIDDPQRFLPEKRFEFFRRLRRELDDRRRPYVLIGGSWEDRFTSAVKAVEALLSARKGSE
jgi:NadR type nicotinamide-nucleotide adenylyltransferase